MLERTRNCVRGSGFAPTNVLRPPSSSQSPGRSERVRYARPQARRPESVVTNHANDSNQLFSYLGTDAAECPSLYKLPAHTPPRIQPSSTHHRTNPSSISALASLSLTFESSRRSL